MHYLTIKNNQPVLVKEIPVVSYMAFLILNTGMVSESTARHCVNYFGYKEGNAIKLICCIADDTDHQIYVSSCLVETGNPYHSFSAKQLCFEKFEREIHENFGIDYSDHPWLKPVRFSHDRFDKNKEIAGYPFYSIDSEELHEVGVGPIHAGVIEPGHFRFICNGEQILHLEIQLGYQHRGIEKLFLDVKSLKEKATLSENIAGDTVVGHATAFAHTWESLCNFQTTPDIDFSRTIALELERIAIHTGDLSALCTDIAYQLGSAVFGRLRTPIVNFMQEWCGNRLSKGFIRPGLNRFPVTRELADRLLEVLDTFEPDFTEMNVELSNLPSALSRFERTGVVSTEDAITIGVVGMAARSSGLKRDVRNSHPYSMYPRLNHEPVVKHHGDVYSRVQIRREEVFQSIKHIRELLKEIPEVSPSERDNLLNPGTNLFTLSLVEGWRGEICHAAITGPEGELLHYKIKDPSFHNWMALALAVRNNEISDFPICNKSFNLSYCGHDL
ncbi:MAG: NADH dehydrogenase subunit [Bacteroidales bacterium]|nr:NADH dehydrogenase subunit [Bacteroidales bacterium]